MISITFNDWSEASLVASVLDKNADQLESIGAINTARECQEVALRIRRAIHEEDERAIKAVLEASA